MPPIKIAREELYRQVWDTPMSRLAARFGVSDVAMAKTCHRLGIPKPGRGHWARLAAGERIRRPPLPKAGPRQPNWIVFDYDENPPPKPPRVEPPVVRTPEDLSGAEKAIQLLGRALGKAKVDEHERLVIPGRKDPMLAVTVEAHRRALLLLDSISKALVSRGHAVAFRQEGSEDRRFLTFALVVEGEAIETSVVERLDREDHVLTADEERRAKQGDRYGVPKYDYHPGGRLQLSLHESFGARNSWSDGEIQRLEHHLGRVVLAAEAAAQVRKRGREEAARRQQEQEQRRREEEKERQRRREEEARAKYLEALGKDLKQMARDWSVAEEVRRFLSAIDDGIPSAARDDGFNAWFQWASVYASQLDPLSQPNRIAKSLHPVTKEEHDSNFSMA